MWFASIHAAMRSLPAGQSRTNRRFSESATAERAELPRAEILVIESTFGDPRYRLTRRALAIEQLLELVYAALAREAEKASTQPALFEVTYPLGAFGRAHEPEQPGLILFKNATVWTSGPRPGKGSYPGSALGIVAMPTRSLRA